MHSHHSSEQTKKGWRNNWLVKNVLTEIPIIGAIFHSDNIPHVLHHAGKSTAMLVGGTTGMMLDIIKSDEADSMVVGMTKATTNMAIGMMAGNVAYNVLFSIGNKAYQACKPNPSVPSSTSPLPEISNQQPLIRLDDEEPSSTTTYTK